MNRNNILEDIRKQNKSSWDVIVIGGGATGLGIALDAVTRGYKTILLEQSDFSKGTSSKSTKLVHGGVRYMAQGDLLLVTEALHERGMLLRNAPHLTFNQEFIIPVYKRFDAFLYTAGLKFYDLLAGRLSMGKSYFINRVETLRRLPLLRSSGLRGGIVYHDGQFDDSRLAVEMAKLCTARGGAVLNYCRVTGLIKNAAGKIEGVNAVDLMSETVLDIYGKVVINATGIFADQITRHDDPSAPPSLRPSQGVHIVLPGSFLQSSSAVMIPKTDDGRVLFAIPWYDEVVIGTTDTPVKVIDLEPVALEEEIEFILNTAGTYLKIPVSRKDVLSVFAGLRPLAADPENKGSTKEVSRRHKIIVTRSGLFSVVGGKWTTYRRMAEETLDLAIKKGYLPRAKCITRQLRFFSGELTGERFAIYGDGAAEINGLIAFNPQLGEPLDPRLPYTTAEIIWICRNEMPVNIEDMLARRTRALFLNARASSDIAPVVAVIMAEEMGYDEQWQHIQVRAYRELVKNYLLE